MSNADTVELVPYSELLGFINLVRAMRDTQKQFLKIRAEQPHVNLDAIYRIVKTREAEVDLRIREETSRANTAISNLFGEGGGN